MTPRELFEIIDDLCKVHGVEKVKTTILSFFEILEKEKETKTENGENIFTEFTPYVGGDDTTSKEELLKHFQSFLEFPEHWGVFIVMWKENDTFVNRFSLDDYIKQIKRGEEIRKEKGE